MIVHCLITRGDEWILELHLRAYLGFCDRIVAVVDRSPESLVICRRHPQVIAIPWQGAARPDFNDRGLLLDEGAMRQAAWDMAMALEPELVVFGDTDEIPTPDIVPWLASDPDPSVEHWYADWVNLWGDTAHALGGASEWSFQNPRANKKGLVTRPMPGKTYRYRLADQHVRMEPSPLNESRAVLDDAHRMAPDGVKLIHHKYASDHWRNHPMRRLERFASMAAHATIVEIPPHWTAWT